MTVLRKFPTEAIQFEQIIPRLLRTILSVDLRWGLVFVSKFYLADIYMRVYICLYYLPWIAFVVPPHLLDTNTLIGFCLSLPMEYVYSAP